MRRHCKAVSRTHSDTCIIRKHPIYNIYTYLNKRIFHIRHCPLDVKRTSIIQCRLWTGTSSYRFASGSSIFFLVRRRAPLPCTGLCYTNGSRSSRLINRTARQTDGPDPFNPSDRYLYLLCGSLSRLRRAIEYESKNIHTYILYIRADMKCHWFAELFDSKANKIILSAWMHRVLQ